MMGVIEYTSSASISTSRCDLKQTKTNLEQEFTDLLQLFRAELLRRSIQAFGILSRTSDWSHLWWFLLQQCLVVFIVSSHRRKTRFRASSPLHLDLYQKLTSTFLTPGLAALISSRVKRVNEISTFSLGTNWSSTREVLRASVIDHRTKVVERMSNRIKGVNHETETTGDPLEDLIDEQETSNETERIYNPRTFSFSVEFL